MITVQFQALEDYELNEKEEQAVTKMLQGLADKYPKLFKEEIVADVRFSQNKGTTDTEISIVAFIPKHGKLLGNAVQQTVDQAVSELKHELDRACLKMNNKYS